MLFKASIGFFMFNKLLLLAFSSRDQSHNCWQNNETKDHHDDGIPVNANELTLCIHNAKLSFPVIFNQQENN